MLGNIQQSAIPYAFGGQLESEFLDSFSSDPIGAAVRYNQGLEKLAAEREAAQAAAIEEANQIAAQQAIINPEVQNQGMQFTMEPAVPVLDTFIPLSSPSAATDDYSMLKSSLKKSEGFSRKATVLSGENHPTIGYGFYNVYPGTTRKVKVGDTITEEEADKYLETAIRERADELSRKIPNWDRLNSGQKDALIDLAFNAGSNAPHFRKNSKLMKALANEDWETAAANLATTSKNPAFKKGMRNRSNRRRNMFMGDYGLKAFGGELGTNGTDFTNGLLYIDEGGSHEDNPLDGVPMGLDPEGIPNLVEEGETVYNNYVFSDRLKVPFFMYKELGLGGVMKKKGKEMSFADASKKLAQESEQRPNDPISQAGLQASLSKLAEIQETERMRKQAKEYTGLQEYSCGGRMTKKYPNGGYLWDDFWKTTNPTSKKKGNSSNKYQIDTTYKGNVKDREAESDYQAFTNYMLNDASDEERLKYFRWIDDNTGRKRTYTDANGNLLDGWQQKYRDARTDGLWGIQHYTPKKASTALSSSIAFDQDLANAAVMADMERQAAPVITDDVRQRIALDEYTPDTTERAVASAGERAAAEGDNEGEDSPKTYATWMRYAPAVGAGIMTLTDALGLTNKPDYTYADALAAAARRAGYAPKIGYNPVGNYLTYRPLDIWYEQNRANALSRATDRNIMNTSGGNRGTAMAGLIANGYNSQLASGNLYRQAVESNLEQRKQVEDFNRRTNMFNSQMGLEADIANARYHQTAQQLGLNGLAQAAALRDSIDSRIGAARSANITNFLNSLGNIGRENFALNQLNWDKSRNYSTDASGRSSYKRKRKAK
jgi:GH24 family phage-related lysozyme (muramidase)